MKYDNEKKLLDYGKITLDHRKIIWKHLKSYLEIKTDLDK